MGELLKATSTLKTEERRNKMTSNQVMNTQDSATAMLAYSQKSSVKVEKADFSSFMNSSKDATNAKPEKLSDESNKAGTRKPEKVNEAVKDSVKPAEDTKDTTEVTDVKNYEERPVEETDVDTLKEAITSVTLKIEEELDVTEEEITEALTNLGLTQTALLIPEIIPEVAIELSDADGAISLVTNAELYEAIGEITKTVEEILPNLEEDLDIDPEVFEAVLKEASVIPAEETLIDTELPVKKEETETPVIENNVRSFEIRPESKEVKNEEVPANEEPTVELNIAKAPIANGENLSEQSSNENLSQTVKTETTVPTNDEHEVKDPIVTFTQNLIDKTREALNAKEVTTVYTEVETKAIIDQITESIRVEATPETTEISLRLHPESLGNVSVRISANHEGAMTAQFIAQNESVKAIIESQALVLRETLEAKGVTVEAVEVMVGSHEFERNLSDSERRNEEQQTRSRAVRRLNLDAEDETELEDEDILRQDIMRQNGNTIDYTV
jgi:flagellar hook-length control protein FliK